MGQLGLLEDLVTMELLDKLDLLEVMVNKVLLDQLDLLDLLVKLDQLAGVVLEV